MLHCENKTSGCSKSCQYLGGVAAHQFDKKVSNLGKTLFLFWQDARKLAPMECNISVFGNQELKLSLLLLSPLWPCLLAADVRLIWWRLFLAAESLV